MVKKPPVTLEKNFRIGSRRKCCPASERQAADRRWIGQTGPKLYAIAANHVNQAVLGFTETINQFKKQLQLPGRISVPDLLDMQGQVASC
ncbi:TPA: hypothetical protein ACH3X1_005544 [Trebouxia sp. C0004]